MSYSNQMIEAIQNEQLSKAEDLLELALERDTLEELYALTETLFDLGFLEETKRVVTHLLTVDENDGLKLTLAELAIEEGNELEAFEWIDQVDEASPYYPQSLLVAADYYQVLDLPEVSKQKLLEAKSLLPNEPVIDFALAELLFASGDYREAIASYEELLIQNHTEFAGTSIYGRLGNAYGAIGEWAEAEGYLKEAVEVKETSDHLFQLGYIYFQQKEYERANDLFSQVKELDPSYTSVYTFLAQGYLELNDEKKALESVEEGLYYDTHNAALYSMGAEAALALGDEAKAEDFYKQAMLIEPDNLSLLLHLTNLLINQERYEDALPLVEEKVESGEEDPQLFWNSAVIYNELEVFDRAREHYDKAYPYLKETPTFLKEYMYFLREDGDRVGYIQKAKEYLALNPGDFEVSELIKNEEYDEI
ncbi:tetratricopeptide repeat protein [Alkalibacterium iburiense]|uniref:Tetratricopeptide repeat protein n=1 Tax=Alkalibacterium iburiense TaxID=290589 RepID=A0ABN0XEY7_9LACT